MANNSKKYISLNRLSTFLGNLKNLFATKTDLNTELAKKADSTHTHSISNVTNLQTTLDGKVPTSRTVNGKALTSNITLSASDVGAASSSHSHDDKYYTETEIDTKLAAKSDTTHNHDAKYDAKGSASAVQTNLDVVSDTLDDHTTNTDIHVTTTNKSNWNTAYNHSQAAHARTDATKVADSTTNGNILINGIETNVYSHPNSGVSAGTYKSVTVNAQGHVTGGSNPTTLSGYGITDAETKTDASSKLTEAKTYADNAANAVKNDLLNNAGAAYDTLKELGDLIDDNKDAIDALEDIAAGKANATHTHAISDVTNLQSALDGKANSSHGTHVTYSTAAPVMDGTASVGTASTVARSDHKHPTDTSRASKTEFDSHNADTTKHITSTERTNWGTAYTHSQSAHAPSDAQKNQNAFSNIAVSGQTTVAADTTTDTVTFAGSNISITTDATNDKVTFSVANGTTSAKGVVQLTDSTSSTSTTTAATPKNVKAAYDLANTAKTNAATAQSKADSAYSLAESKVDSLSDLGITVTATELNYMDGVTSNVQTQLDTISDDLDSHTHSASDITSGTISANRLPSATNTASGVVTTSAQTFAGDKTFTGDIITTDLRPSTANTNDIGTGMLPFRNTYTKNLYINPQVISGSVSHCGKFIMENVGTKTTKGITKLEVGNFIEEGRDGNAQGCIQIFNNDVGSVILETGHDDDRDIRIYLPESPGTILTDNDAYKKTDTYSKTELNWTQIYDSSSITNSVNAIYNINISGYNKIMVAVKCVNNANSASRAGSVILKSSNGTTYQFPVWTNLFTTSAATSAGMAEFDIINGYIVCPYATRSINVSNFLSPTEGGTADNLVNTGGGILRCANWQSITSLTVSSLDQDANYYFKAGSRVIVWGCKA